MEGCFLWLSEPWPLPRGFWEWSPRAPPLERVQSGAGVVWLLCPQGDEQVFQGLQGAPWWATLMISGLGHRWLVASTRAFTPGDASSLLGWSPPEGPRLCLDKATKTSAL